MKLPRWLLLSIAVPVLWGLWGALTEIPEKWLNPSFPPTLGYAVWSLTMLPVSVIAFRKIKWKLTLTGRSIFYGCAVGFSGAAGQLMLFWVLQQGPAYLIFPDCLPFSGSHDRALLDHSARAHLPAGSLRHRAFSARNFSCLAARALQQPGSRKSLAGRHHRDLLHVGTAGLLHEVLVQRNQRRGALHLYDCDGACA